MSINDPEFVTVRLYLRWHRVRQQRPDLVPPLLQEGPCIWTFSNPSDPWGSRSRLSLEALTALVESVEAMLARRDVASETRVRRAEEKTA